MKISVVIPVAKRSFPGEKKATMARAISKRSAKAVGLGSLLDWQRWRRFITQLRRAKSATKACVD